MDEAGVETAHLVGNSLGGYLALVLATRGRARVGRRARPRRRRDDHDGDARDAGARRRCSPSITTRPLPPDVVALPDGRRSEHCDVAPLIAQRPRATAGRWTPSKVRCPVRILWGLEDKLLPWPQAAERYRRSLDAEWIELDGVGHAPQLDVPLETAQLIVGFTAM